MKKYSTRIIFWDLYLLYKGRSITTIRGRSSSHISTATPPTIQMLLSGQCTSFWIVLCPSMPCSTWARTARSTTGISRTERMSEGAHTQVPSGGKARPRVWHLLVLIQISTSEKGYGSSINLGYRVSSLAEYMMEHGSTASSEETLTLFWSTRT